MIGGKNTNHTRTHTQKKNQIWDQLLPITEPQAEGKGYAESDVGRRRKRHLQSMHCKHKHARPRPYTTRARSNIRLSLCAARHNIHSASRQMLSLALIRPLAEEVRPRTRRNATKDETRQIKHRWQQRQDLLGQKILSMDTEPSSRLCCSLFFFYLLWYFFLLNWLI